MVCQNDDCDNPSLAEIVDHSCSACADDYVYCPRCIVKRDPGGETTIPYIANTARIAHVIED